MKNVVLYLAFIFSIVFLYGFAYSFAQGDEPAGKKIFIDKKCSSCHSVESFEITSKKKDASDLSNVGAELKADFLMKYLNKKEKLNDELHKTAFKGTDEELKVLSEWLASLKKDKK